MKSFNALQLSFTKIGTIAIALLVAFAPITMAEAKAKDKAKAPAQSISGTLSIEKDTDNPKKIKGMSLTVESEEGKSISYAIRMDKRSMRLQKYDGKLVTVTGALVPDAENAEKQWVTVKKYKVEKTAK